MKTIIIGLGNPILGDDGVGWRIAETLRDHTIDSADIECAALGGLSLMERMIGYDRAIVIDAFETEQTPGVVIVSDLASLSDHRSMYTSSAHDTSIQHALSVGRMMGAHLPADVKIVGVTAQRLYDFTEELTPLVAAAIPIAAEQVLRLLDPSKGGLS
jgi:hydrogenase maturation protease